MIPAASLTGAVGPPWRTHAVTVRLAPTGDDTDAIDLRLEPGQPIQWGPAGTRRATVLLSADSKVLADVTGGLRSGVDAFLDGELKVRGDLALALSLDAVFSEGRDEDPSQIRRIDLDDGSIRTAAWVSGPAQEQPVVLVHGLGATSASMLPIQRALSLEHHVLSLDLLGHGDTDKPHGRYDASMLADWLIRSLDVAGLDRVALIGNSLGGRISIELGLRHPDRVAGMVLLCPSVAFVKVRQAVPLVRLVPAGVTRALLPTPTHANVVNGIKAMFSRPDRLPDSWYAAGADEFLRIWRTAPGRRALVTAARQIYLEKGQGRRGFWARLPALEPSTLWIWGERDRLVPHSFSRQVARALPAAHQVVLPDSGHVPQFEHPALSVRLVKGHLATLAW